MKYIENLDDCIKICEVLLAKHSIYATLEEVQDFWSWRSDRWDASWLIVDNARLNDLDYWVSEYMEVGSPKYH